MAADLKKAEEFAKIYGYAGQSNGSAFGPSKLHDTDKYGIGSSIFHLVTYTNDTDANTRYVIGSGLLSELPEFSFSVKFNDGPGKATQDIIQQLFDNDLFKFINAAGSADSDFVNTISIGTLTNEMYGGVETSDIPLKFRVYRENTLGQTSISLWKDILTKYAVPSSSNRITVENGVQNIMSAMKNAEGLGNDIIKIFLNSDDIGPAAEEDKGVKSSTQQQQAINAEYDEGVKAINQYAEAILVQLGTVKQGLISAFNYGQAKEDVGHIKINDIYYKYSMVEQWNLTSGLNAIKSKIDDVTGQHVKCIEIVVNYMYDTRQLPDEISLYIPLYTNNQDIIGDSNQELSYLSAWCVNYSKDQNTGKISITWNQSKFDEQMTMFKDRIKKITRGSEPAHLNKFVDDLKTAIGKATFDRYEDPIKKDRAKLVENIEKVKGQITQVGGMADKIQKIGEKRFGLYRAAGELNKKNGLGEKLWELYIYNNFLFKDATPLTVYIKDWEIVDSKECTELGPVYADISITCSLDQDYSTNQWINLLDPLKLGVLSTS